MSRCSNTKHMRAWLNRTLRIAGLCGALLAGGCNATLNDATAGGTTTPASATGVWTGTDSVSGLTVIALINAAGQATFIRGDGLQFTGSVQVSGTTLVAAVAGYTDFSATFGDGSTYGIGTLNGSVMTADSITASLSFTSNGGTAVSGSWSLNFQGLSNNASSDSTISGNYTDAVTGAVLSITSLGVMSSQNPANNCVLNGSLTTHDTAHDLYEVSYTFGNCTSTYALLNGVQFTGLATLNTNVSPAQITMAVVGTPTTGNQYGIVSTLNGS
jgi:hypothetical protein